MTDSATRGEDRDKARTTSERVELLRHLEALLEPLLASLGLVFLAILLLDLSGVLDTPEQQLWLDRAINVIWGIFIVDFLVRLVIAPDKRRYLARNWLTLLSLIVPFLRPFRALQAVTAIRSLSLIRLLAGVNRGMRVLQRYTRGRQIAYVAALTVLVMLTGAVAVYFFDQDEPESPIQTLGEALWWSATMITTINSDLDAVSAEGRVIGVLQRVFAVSVFGFVTASIASYLIGRSVEERTAAELTDPVVETVRTELAALRRENDALRADVAAMRQAVEQLAERG